MTFLVFWMVIMQFRMIIWYVNWYILCFHLCILYVGQHIWYLGTPLFAFWMMHFVFRWFFGFWDGTFPGLTVLGPIYHFLRADSWALGPNCPGPSCLGPNCLGPYCPGPNLPRTFLTNISLPVSHLLPNFLDSMACTGDYDIWWTG